MKKIILITGATDGIGLETAKLLAAEGHHLLLHGRNPDKLKKLAATLSAIPGVGPLEIYTADLSSLSEVNALSEAVMEKHNQLDVLINNAGVFRVPNPITADGLDLRFVVNTIAPWLLTERLLPLFGSSGRVINLSSAAQSSVDLEALAGKSQLSHGMAYAQSKLALTMWSRAIANSIGDSGPSVVAVNPGSMLAIKMVKEAYGVDGGDIRIGADILRRAALSEEFDNATGKYFDNDSRRFTSPHTDALNEQKCKAVVRVIADLVEILTK